MELLILKVAIILVVGFIGGKLAERYGLPSVSGYLLFGIFLGPSVGLIFKGFEGVITEQDGQSLKFISEIALAFIAFSIGSEFNLVKLKKIGNKFLTIANYEVLFAVLLVFTVLFFIPKPAPIMNGYEPFSKGNLALGLILASMSAATAPAATLIVMREYRAYGPLTKTVLPVVALDDMHGIVIFGFLFSIAQALISPASISLGFTIAKPFIEVFGSLLLGGIIGYILTWTLKKVKKNNNNYQAASLAAILLTSGTVLMFNKLFHEIDLGLSTLLANMMVGTVVANLSKNADDSFKSVNYFTNPFFILFFTIAGAGLDLGILKNDVIILAIAVAYIFARGFGKYFGAYVGAKKSNADEKVRKYIGFALLPQGGVSLGLLVIVSSRLPLYYPLISTIIMLSILVYETTGPIFAKIAISKAGEINGLDQIEGLGELEI